MNSYAIRHFASTWSGSVIAAGEFERTVHVWDLNGPCRLATFPTILDFGGKRLAVTPEGTNCIAAAYHVEGIAAYAVPEGREIWRRKDLKKTQTLRVSLDGRRVYACLERRGCQVLHRETGRTLKAWAGVRDVWESPYEPLMLLEKTDVGAPIARRTKDREHPGGVVWRPLRGVWSWAGVRVGECGGASVPGNPNRPGTLALPGKGTTRPGGSLRRSGPSVCWSHLALRMWRCAPACAVRSTVRQGVDRHRTGQSRRVQILSAWHSPSVVRWIGR